MQSCVGTLRSSSAKTQRTGIFSARSEVAGRSRRARAAHGLQRASARTSRSAALWPFPASVPQLSVSSDRDGRACQWDRPANQPARGPRRARSPSRPGCRRAPRSARGRLRPSVAGSGPRPGRLAPARRSSAALPRSPGYRPPDWPDPALVVGDHRDPEQLAVRRRTPGTPRAALRIRAVRHHDRRKRPGAGRERQCGGDRTHAHLVAGEGRRARTASPRPSRVQTSPFGPATSVPSPDVAPSTRPTVVSVRLKPWTSPDGSSTSHVGRPLACTIAAAAPVDER